LICYKYNSDPKYPDVPSLLKIVKETDFSD
jgi:hypothetical protein